MLKRMLCIVYACIICMYVCEQALHNSDARNEWTSTCESFWCMFLQTSPTHLSKSSFGCTVTLSVLRNFIPVWAMLSLCWWNKEMNAIYPAHAKLNRKWFLVKLHEMEPLRRRKVIQWVHTWVHMYAEICIAGWPRIRVEFGWLCRRIELIQECPL